MRNVRVSNGVALEKLRAAFNTSEAKAGFERARQALNDPRIKDALSQARGRLATGGGGRGSNWNPRGSRRGS